MKKLVTLLLVLAMIMSMTVVVSAAEADTMPIVGAPESRVQTFQRANEIATASLGTDEYGNKTFETFADLKELASGTYSDWTMAHYVGSAEEFVISENIVLPMYLDVYIGGPLVKIQEGVTCTVKNYLAANKLTVNGTLVLDDGGLYVKDALTVNGALNYTGYISLGSDATLVGLDNVKRNEYGYIAKSLYASTEAEVYAALTAAANDTNGFRYNIDIGSSVTLNSDFTIPDNVDLLPAEKLTINGACTVKGYLYAFEAPIVVNGKLINNGQVSLEYTTLNISSGASYSGNGTINCYGIKPEEALVGVNLDDFQIENWGDDSYNLTYIAGKIKLGSATDLTWGIQHGWGWDDEAGKLVNDPAYDVALPGVASFKRASLDQAQYEIELYKVGQESPVTSTWWEMDAANYDALWYDVHFIDAINESGDYYFTVAAEGDGIEYADGPAVKSDVWTYVKPAKALTTPTQLAWDWPYVTFNIEDNKSNIFGIYVEFYYTDVLGGEPQWAGAVQYHSVTDKVEMDDYFVKEYGVGYYTFKVKMLSSDLNTVANSEWSAISPAYYLAEVPNDAEDIVIELDKIISSDTTTEEIRDAVQTIDTESLKEAMQEDTGNSGIMESIAALEEAVGGPAAVEVSEEAAAFDVSKVSIVGANLNNAESESAPITLVLDKPEEEHVLDTLYNSAVAVSFSMDLENVKDTENLEVPVKITLPVPETINPNFLVILHYHANGTVEEVHPYIFRDGGQWYAEMVLTSFSDFVMTETVEEEEECTHSWSDATCTAPKTCKTCGATDGDKLPHSFDQEKIDPKYQAGENTYYKSCKCGEKGTEIFTVNEEKPEEKPEVKPAEFKDVPTNAFYYDAVMWAVENGITTGTGADTFSPDAICNRGQVVTFLWRAAGEPEPKNAENPFVDVKSSDYFYKAVLWAKENGITTGTSATTFAPNENCNRGQIVTFLSRAKNGQPTTSKNPFKDVAESAFYYNPVLWAVEKGITTGTGDGTTFAPNEDCTRGQVITFLWRAYTK